MVENSFFEVPKEQSIIKSKIITDYFVIWATIISKHVNKIAYIDLFSGQGIYEDGTYSTPLLILEKAISNPEIREKLVSLFFEENKDFCKKLETEISNLTDFEKLKYKPKVNNRSVDKTIASELKNIKMIPSLVFIDPWGYKGLSIDLISAATKDWASECIFFFNYNRINPAINNDLVAIHIDDIFREERANNLRAAENLNPCEREEIILHELTESLRDEFNVYVRPFRFQMEDKDKTSHYLIHVSKDKLGYQLMKEIMSKYSTKVGEIPTYEFIHDCQLSLFQPTIEDLSQDLLKSFAGREISMVELYEEHNIEKPYIKSNYKKALILLLNKNLIEARGIKRSNSFADNAIAIFK